MRIIQMNCPRCGGQLEIEDSIDTFFCKYCGQRIVLADQQEYVLKAKIDVERMKHDEKMFQMQAEEERKKRNESFVIIKYIAIFIAIMVGISFIMLILIQLGIIK